MNKIAIKIVIAAFLSAAAIVGLKREDTLHFRFKQLIPSTEWLNVSQVVIHAEWPLTDERVRNWLPKLVGENLLLLSANAIIEDLKKRPWVDEVVLKKQYPDRIDISVKTKEASAILVSQGRGVFIDRSGHLIEKAKPSLFSGHDLLVISHDKLGDEPDWKISDVLTMISSFDEKLGEIAGEISEVRLGSYPVLRIFPSRYKVEVTLSLESWSQEISQLITLLKDPPPGLPPIRKINLTVSKKAIVS